MSGSRKAFLSLGVLSVFLITACGKNEPESNGVIARVNGQVKVLSAQEQKDLCSTEFCEPNYIYSVNFGKKRPEPTANPTPTAVPSPRPPTPRPSASPAPTSTPSPSGDRLDYSRQILKVEEAWARTQGSREVVVAVIDTGVEVSHPDLRNNIWVNERELNGQPGVDDDGNGYVDDVHGYDFVNNRPNGIDDNKHGTHCAGIIGAELNGSGTVGVSPYVRIMPLKFLSARGSGDAASAIRAIDYAIANGAHIISNSWGGGGRSQLMDDAIQRAVSQGILVVAAAGNSSSDNDRNASYPAGYANVIAVGSTEESDRLSSFSNYGRTSVLLAAPGSNIYSSVLRGQYAELSGTSMATPQVSGALALALSLNTGASASELTADLCSSSRAILKDRVKCGRMDVSEFLRKVSQR